jgi:hypothetical protein
MKVRKADRKVESTERMFNNRMCPIQGGFLYGGIVFLEVKKKDAFSFCVERGGEYSLSFLHSQNHTSSTCRISERYNLSYDDI